MCICSKFLEFVKENRFRLYKKHLKRYKENSLKDSIVLPNGNSLEKEFENFNRDEVSKKDSLGGDKNDEEEE